LQALLSCCLLGSRSAARSSLGKTLMCPTDAPTSTEGSAREAAPDAVGFDTLYRRLRAICGQRLQAERLEHTLQATALANEVWMRLHELDPVKASDPGNATRWFVANAVIAVQHVLVDHARRRLRIRRGGGRGRSELTEDLSQGDARLDQEAAERVVAASQLLRELADHAPLQAEIVSLRFYGGLTLRQIADHVGTSEPTVRRELAFAQVWLGSRPGAAGWFEP
jgi:RNA polymerase sigma-70 factor, ECF subfamily